MFKAWGHYFSPKLKCQLTQARRKCDFLALGGVRVNEPLYEEKRRGKKKKKKMFLNPNPLATFSKDFFFPIPKTTPKTLLAPPGLEPRTSGLSDEHATVGPRG